jgi:outer membrane biosynthesis protein TonB
MTASLPSFASLELLLPWESTTQEDRYFRRILLSGLAVFLVLGLLVPRLNIPQLLPPPPDPDQPQLARVILEKKSLPVVPPPAREPVRPPPPVEVEPVQEPQVEPEPEPVAKVQPAPAAEITPEQARAEAAGAGVLAFQDDLMEMRDSLDVSQLQQDQLQRGADAARKTERALLARSSDAASRGIDTAQLSRDTGGPALAAREATRVDSGAAAATGARREQSQSVRLGGRSDESVRRVMDSNKGAIFALYNRALRSDPLLEGKLVFEMLIDSAGVVTEVSLLSSELGDATLVRKILARIRMIKFPQADVATTKVNYSFDFLPYS